MIVCIAEKPSVAAEIARILGANRDCRDSQRQGWYEGNGYQVTWTFGHLCELKSPDQYSDMWRPWTLAALPMIPQRFGIRLKEGVEGQFAYITRLFKSADRIVNCGDAGQEGELIQRWVYQLSGATCPVDRLWVNSMTDEAIRDGFAHLKPQEDYQPLYEAGLCRAIGDWLLGMNTTRLYTLKYGDRNRGSQPLSIGRVQTPTLALVVARQEEIANFRPEPYWVLSTVYRDVTFTAITTDNDDDDEGKKEAGETDKGKGSSLARRGYTDRAEAEAALAAVRDVPLTVTRVEKKKGREAPPRLYDLTTLQVDCNRKFGYGADLTLQIVQQLYENKFTTYPRVDTTYLPDDVYPRCGTILAGIGTAVVPQPLPPPSPTGEGVGTATYGALLAPLRGAPLRKSSKTFDNSKVTDHHAIIPTGVAPRGLSDVQWKVYDLIARQFIAAFYPDCTFATTTVTAEVAGVDFRATGKVITDPGWKAVFAKDKSATPAATLSLNTPVPAQPMASSSPGQDKEKGEVTQEMPPFVKGESGPHVPTLVQKETKPPQLYTEGSLLRAMQTAGRTVDDEELRDALRENGIGRPSTRDAIIQTLYRRGYLRKAGRTTIEATPTGIALIGLIREDLLKSAELTGRWEKKLRQIERKEYSAAQFVAELKQMVTDIVGQVMADPTLRRLRPPSLSPRPLQPPSVPPTGGKKERVPTGGKKGEEGAVPAAKPKRKIIRAGSVCPECGQGKVIKGHANYGCSRWREGCTWRKPFKK